MWGIGRVITGWMTNDDLAYASWPEGCKYPKAAMFQDRDRTIALCRARIMPDGIYYRCHLDNKITESWFHESYFEDLERLT